jgi:hypothetical protein
MAFPNSHLLSIPKKFKKLLMLKKEEDDEEEENIALDAKGLICNLKIFMNH